MPAGSQPTPPTLVDRSASVLTGADLPRPGSPRIHLSRTLLPPPSVSLILQAVLTSIMTAVKSDDGHAEHYLMAIKTIVRANTLYRLFLANFRRISKDSSHLRSNPDRMAPN